MSQSGGSKPQLKMLNTNADGNGAELLFEKQSASEADGDNLGQITFKGHDDGNNVTSYAQIKGRSIAVRPSFFK